MALANRSRAPARVILRFLKRLKNSMRESQARGLRPLFGDFSKVGLADQIAIHASSFFCVFQLAFLLNAGRISGQAWPKIRAFWQKPR